VRCSRLAISQRGLAGEAVHEAAAAAEALGSQNRVLAGFALTALATSTAPPATRSTAESKAREAAGARCWHRRLIGPTPSRCWRRPSSIKGARVRRARRPTSAHELLEQLGTFEDAEAKIRLVYAKTREEATFAMRGHRPCAPAAHGARGRLLRSALRLRSSPGCAGEPGDPRSCRRLRPDAAHELQEHLRRRRATSGSRCRASRPPVRLLCSSAFNCPASPDVDHEADSCRARAARAHPRFDIAANHLAEARRAGGGGGARGGQAQRARRFDRRQRCRALGRQGAEVKARESLERPRRKARAARRKTRTTRPRRRRRGRLGARRGWRGESAKARNGARDHDLSRARRAIWSARPGPRCSTAPA